MNNFTERPHRSEADLPRVLQLVRRCEPFVSWTFNPNELPADPEDARIWEDADGKLLGTGFLYTGKGKPGDPAALVMVVDPDARGRVELSILRWGQERARFYQPGQPVIACRACVDDRYRVHLLEANGFVARDGRETVYMSVGLPLQTPSTQAPPGFSIRPFSKKQDLEKWMVVWEHTMGYMLSRRDRLGWLGYPSYLPDLDLVAEGPGGELAGYGVGNIFWEEDRRLAEDSAWILWLGTEPVFRGRGLGRALTQALLRCFADHGCHQVLLNVTANNQEAIRLYGQLGFKMLYRMCYYVSK